MKINQLLEAYGAQVSRALEIQLKTAAVSPTLQEAMQYSLLAGGKRVRPALAYAACEAVGGKSEDATPAAAALEMIHTYSLIHDDLPAMDNDDLRRGRPSNHKVYGDAVAILAGDGLLTEAFAVLADTNWKIPAEQRMDIVRIVANGAGAVGMVAGQALDLEFEGKKVNETTLEKIHRHKTGKLLTASVLAGGRAGGASGEAMERLQTFGVNIGLAFQIADDVLDLTATTQELGKDAKSDLKKQKATYPSLIGIDESRKRAAALLQEALAAIEPLGAPSEKLAMLGRFIVERRS